MKEAFPSVCGSARLRRAIADDIESGAFAHAYLLEGPKGSGKEAFARAVAAALACEKKTDPLAPLPCGTCGPCARILSSLCPDVQTIGPDEGKATIGVDRIRRLKESLILTPGELDFKCYIIKEADRMTPQAQNSLLKMLEEPPGSRTVYLLLAENAQKLLPTVRSRAPVLRLSPPTRRELAAYLKDTLPFFGVDADFAAAASGGNLALAEAIYQKKKEAEAPLADRALVAETVGLFGRDCSRGEFLLFFNRFPQKKEELLALLRLIYRAMRDIIAAKRTERFEPDFFLTPEEASACASRISVKGAAALSSLLTDTADELEKNAAPKTLLPAFALRAYHARGGIRP